MGKRDALLRLPAGLDAKHQCFGTFRSSIVKRNIGKVFICIVIGIVVTVETETRSCLGAHSTWWII